MSSKTKVKTAAKKLALAASAAIITGTTAVSLPYFVGEKVVEVVDGDTFIIANRQPIRLYGLDAPALEYCYGQQAKQALSALIQNRRVVLREPLSDGRGRVMALVYVDGKLVNEILIRNGYGVYRRQGGAETKNMKSANDYARANSLGVFSSRCYQPHPPDQDCAIKGNVDDRSGKKLFFPPDCHYYNLIIVEKNMGEDWFCTAKQAQKAGFSLSPSCL